MLVDEEGKQYIGSRSDHGCSPEEDNYWSSSKYIKKVIQDGVKFTKIILMRFETYEEAYRHEILLHDCFDVGVNANFYNKAKATTSGFSRKGIAVLPETRARLSASNRGKSKLRTAEHNHRIGLAQIGNKRGPQSESQRNKHSIAMTGRIQSDEVRNKIAEKLKGKKKSPEHVLNIQKAQQLRREREALTKIKE